MAATATADSTLCHCCCSFRQQLRSSLAFSVSHVSLSVHWPSRLSVARLDGCLSGGDYAAIILDIEGLLLAACGAIKGYNIGLIGLLTGKLLVIAKIWFEIVVVGASLFLTFPFAEEAVELVDRHSLRQVVRTRRVRDLHQTYREAGHRSEADLDYNHQPRWNLRWVLGYLRRVVSGICSISNDGEVNNGMTGI